MAALYALAIFVTFAVVGGTVVAYIVRNQQDPGPGEPPPRGVPWDSPENDQVE